MPERIHGAASAMQTLTADMEYYVCYASSPLAFTDPQANPADPMSRLVNIMVTGNPRDQSQKNFEVMIMSIGLRAMPVIISNPAPVVELSDHVAELSGQGYIWKFAVERGSQFYNYTRFGTPGPVGLLVDDIDGLFLPSGVRVTPIANSASGWAQNIAFYKMETL